MLIVRDKEYCVNNGVLEGLSEEELRLLEEKWNQLVTEQVKLNNKQ